MRRRPRSRAAITLAAAAMLAPAGARAAPHFVDGAATGAGTGASWADAWETFDAIDWAAIAPGDTIYISGGAAGRTYAEQLTVARSGAPGAPITIASGASSPSPAGHDGTVTIDGAATRAYGVLVEADHVTIRELTVIRAAASGMRARGASVILERNVLDRIYGQAIHFNACNACVARANVVTTLADDPAQSDGVVVYGGADGVVVEGNHFVLTNQGLAHNDCVQSNRCSNLTVRHNFCMNLKDSEGYANAQGIYLTEMSGTNEIYGNLVYLKQGGVAVASRNLSVGTAQSVIVNNTVRCASYRCVRVTDEADPVVKNNVVWQARSAAGLYAISLEGWSGTASNVDGNLCFNQSSTGTLVNSFNGSGMTWTEWQALDLDVHGSAVDPSLDECMRPTGAAAPPVGAGVVLGAPYDQGLAMALCPSTAAAWTADFRLVDRDVVGGGGWDVGAFEHGADATADAGPGPAPDAALRDAPSGDAASGDAAPGDVDSGGAHAPDGGVEPPEEPAGSCACRLQRGAAAHRRGPALGALAALLALAGRRGRRRRGGAHAARAAAAPGPPRATRPLPCLPAVRSSHRR